MRFGPVDTAEAEGGILAHSLKLPGHKLSKGTVITPEHIRALLTAGLHEVIVARLEADETGEDEAAARAAAAVRGEQVRAGAPVNGRCDLYAARPGLLVYDAAELTGLNLVHEAMTLAALPPWSVVETGQLIATIKIIPYGVATTAISRLEARARERCCTLAIREFRVSRIGLLQTQVEGLAERVLDKTRRVTDRRLQLLGNAVHEERRCAHREQAVAAELVAMLESGTELLLVAGASATADRRDVVPLAVELAGGRVIHLGMPVEPGNLLMLAESGNGVPIVCLPGCARSPALNGFDWVLERLLAGVPVTARDVMAMGAGGLIKGAPSRLRDRDQREAGD